MVSRLRHIDVVQFGLICGIFYALFGLIEAVVVWAAMSAVPSGGMHGMPVAGIFLMGPFMLVIFPIVAFIFGFVGGLISAALYNLIAGWTGGIQITLEGVSENTLAAPPL